MLIIRFLRRYSIWPINLQTAVKKIQFLSQLSWYSFDNQTLWRGTNSTLTSLYDIRTNPRWPHLFENIMKHCNTLWPTAMGCKIVVNRVSNQTSHNLLCNNWLNPHSSYVTPASINPFFKVAPFELNWKEWLVLGLCNEHPSPNVAKPSHFPSAELPARS